MILVLDKAENCRVPNLGRPGAESPGGFDFDVSPKDTSQTYCISKSERASVCLHIQGICLGDRSFHSTDIMTATRQIYKKL